MKMSIIVRNVSQVLFWFNCILFFSWVVTQNDSPLMILLMTLFLVVAGFFCRKLHNKLFIFLTHACMIAIPGIFWAGNKLSRMSMLFAVGIIICSLISRYAESEFMDRAHTFGKFALTVLYLTGTIMNYKYNVVLFCCLFAYFFLEFIQNNFEKNEEYADSLNYNSIEELNKTQLMANLMTFIITLIMAAVCGVITLIGIIPPVAGLSNRIATKIKELFDFLKRVDLKPSDKEPVVEDILVPGQTDNISDMDNVLPHTTTDDVVFIIGIVLVTASLIFIIYFAIRKLYKYYLKLQQLGLLDEEVSLKKDKPKKKKINPAELDGSYSNRMALRRIYKKRVKGRKNGRREDFINRTPYEQREKIMGEGNNVSTEFVDMYERARYSKEVVTKEDVRRMSRME